MECKRKCSKEVIIETAVKLFAQKGFARTGVRELACAANVNLAMINYFFGSKNGLLKIILDRFFDQYLVIIRKNLITDDDVETKLSNFIQNASEYFSENPDYLIVTLTELPYDDADILEYKAQWVRKMAEIINSEVCVPLTEQTGMQIQPAFLGPALLGMLASRIIFSKILMQVKPLGLNADHKVEYPKFITRLLLNGIHGSGLELN